MRECAGGDRLRACNSGVAADGPADDAVLDALETVVKGLIENSARIELALERAEQIRRQRLSGWTYAQIVEESTGPLMVEILSTNLRVLHKLGHQLRSTEAQALRSEGLSTIRIAELFGVSRQRVAALLQDRPGHPAHGKGVRPQVANGRPRLTLDWVAPEE
ncbi:MAG TPA: hypothetical protein VG346_11380 [Acidimicrobiales bacterium]|nr:hypothetical protein [Acidimicrobiales bacterium]